MLPQVSWAVEKGYPVLVMNPNHDAAESMDDHALYVWQNYVLNSGFSKLFVIAHSAGGGCLTSIQTQFESSFYQQVSQIAYTDSFTIDKD